MNTKEYINELIQDNEIKKALEFLKANLSGKNSELENSVIMQLSQFNSAFKSLNNGTISNSEYTQTINKIKNAILNYLLPEAESFLPPSVQIDSSTISTHGNGNITISGVSMNGNTTIGTNLTDRKEEAKKIKILFLAANPLNTGRLRIDQESQKIKENLNLAQERDRFDIRTEFAITQDIMMQSVLDYAPTIVHFSGHGSESGIVLQDATGNAKELPAEGLSALFELFKDSVQCVLLNSCYSEAQAHGIRAHIPHVIGMNSEIPDKAALAFCTGFYKALGAGKDFAFAFKMGIVAIKMEGIESSDIPIMVNVPK